jgi:ATP-binding cassette subfamily F protein 3
VSFTINRGDRVGLVGPNGCGKTTLLRIIIGEEKADRGSIRHTVSHLALGYLPQALTFDKEATVRDVLCGSSAADPSRLTAEVEEAASLIGASHAVDGQGFKQRYIELLTELDWATTALPEHEARRVLAGLGLADVSPSTAVRILSGGQKTRVGLARLLLERPDLLLLDEPTNHLDVFALEWLEGYLRDYDGATLIVSHDRTFLDRTVTRILELSAQTHGLKLYEGNYTDYALAVERERERYWQSFKEQQERIAQLQSAVRRLKGQARRIEGETIDFYYKKRAKKVARQAVVQQRRIERLLESEDYLEKPQLSWQMKLDFVNTPPSGQNVLTLTGLTKRFGEHLLFEDANLVLRRRERIVLLGANGSGKTTLLRIIVGQEPATAGDVRLGANVQVGFLSQEQEDLDWALTPLETVRQAAPLGETEARGFLHYFLFAGDEVFVPVGNLSYGERARLSLGVLVLHGCNLLLLDEPINHLDVPSRERFELALSRYEGTILAVVHDRYFVARFATGIWAIQNCRITRYVDVDEMRRACPPSSTLSARR